MNEKKNATWVTEKDAAYIIQLPGSFLRRSVEKGALKALVKFLRLRQYKYLYNKVDLENYIYENPELTDL
jgi:hypothetical protein